MQDTDLKNPVLVLGRVKGGRGAKHKADTDKNRARVRVRVLVRISVVVRDKIRGG